MKCKMCDNHTPCKHIEYCEFHTPQPAPLPADVEKLRDDLAEEDSKGAFIDANFSIEYVAKRHYQRGFDAAVEKLYKPALADISKMESANKFAFDMLKGRIAELESKLSSDEKMAGELAEALEKNIFALQCMIILHNGKVPGLSDEEVFDGAITTREKAKEALKKFRGGKNVQNK